MAFMKDALLVLNNLAYRVLRIVEGKVQLENIKTGEISTHEPDDLLNQYLTGCLQTVPRKKFKERRNSAAPGGREAQPISEVDRIETRRRVDYIVALEREGAFDTNRKALKKAILEQCKLRNEPRPPDVSTIYRWRKKFRAARDSVQALVSYVGYRGGKGKTRLATEVEKIINDCIEQKFLSNRRGCSEDVYDAVALWLKRENAQRPPNDQLKTPGLRTIERRIASLPAYDVAVARYGSREADRRFATKLRARHASRVLEIVEIDHTPVDLLVVDDNRKVLGRPSLTVLLDRYSRTVLGYHFSLAGHGTEAVLEAIRHALLPKNYLKTTYQDLNLTWPCYGWPEKLLMDNGREFHSHAVTDALISLGIISEFAASSAPDDKAHVERFIKTFNYSFVHKLPGTTLSKLSERIGFKSEDDACLTLAELDRITHIWITQKYHIRPHVGLGGRTPLDVWSESARLHPPQLKMNFDELDIHLCRSATSKLQEYGIDLNTFRYASGELSKLCKSLPKKSKVDVRWPWHDAGYVWIWNPYDEEFFKVSNVDDSYDGLTYEQAKLANQQIKADPELRNTRAAASEVIRDEIAKAQSATKLAVRRKGARINNDTSKKSRSPEKEPTSISNPAVEVCASIESDDQIEPYDTEDATS